jgi:glycosyltransferase involved in cell wall biosynthesis
LLPPLRGKLGSSTNYSRCPSQPGYVVTITQKVLAQQVVRTAGCVGVAPATNERLSGEDLAGNRTNYCRGGPGQPSRSNSSRRAEDINEGSGVCGYDCCANESGVSRVRIAYIVTRADRIGGVQVHVRDLAESARAHGHSPTVITGGTGPFVDQLRALEIPTVSLRNLVVPINPLRDLQALQEIRATLRQLRPELLAVHSAKAGILGRLAGRSVQIPVILTAHGWTFTPGIPVAKAALYRQIERSVGHLTSKIITVSEFDRLLALEAGISSEDRIITVYNGVPDIPRELRADPGRTPARLVMVARFEPQKDHASLLRALAGLLDQPWELDFIGDGPLMGPMESLAAALGLRDRVHFRGQRTDVGRFLAQAQVSLLVTNWEGFPLSILEAMRAGLPVVASSIGGISESVRDGETGYLVPRGDVARLRDQIKQLLTSPAQRIRFGANGRSRYEQHFTLEDSVTKTLAVYRDVVAEQAGSQANPERQGGFHDLTEVPK